jgi:hypothetical protein
VGKIDTTWWYLGASVHGSTTKLIVLLFLLELNVDQYLQENHGKVL